MDAPAPGWHPDPTGRHEHRYWDGSRWTDHVADAGVSATDPLDRGRTPDPGQTGGAPTSRTSPAGDQPTAVTDPTQPSPSADRPTEAYPGDGEPTQAYPTGATTQEYPIQPGAAPTPPGWQEGPPPPAPAAAKRPSPAVIVGIAVLVVALIGGIAFTLTRDDDTTDVADRGPTSTAETVEPGQPGDGGAPAPNQPGDGGAPDGGAGGNGSDGPALPGSLGQDVGSDQEMIDLMADSITQSSEGEITHEEAVCMAEAVVDQLGREKLAEIGQSGGTDPFEGLTPAEQGEIVGSIVECVPDALSEGFGG